VKFEDEYKEIAYKMMCNLSQADLEDSYLYWQEISLRSDAELFKRMKEFYKRENERIYLCTLRERREYIKENHKPK